MDDPIISSTAIVSEQGPSFSKEEIFKKRLKELQRFKDANGHLRVTQSLDKSLANWCRDLRYSCRAEGKGAAGSIQLTDERIAALKEIGFEFPDPNSNSREIPLNDRNLKLFNNKLKELQEYKFKHGHLNVSRGHDKSLAKWCINIRCAYRAKLQGKNVKYRLTDERITALREIGFEFPDPNSVKIGQDGNRERSKKIFNIRLKELQKYKLKYGHTMVSRQLDKSLAIWCHVVRTSFRAKEKGQRGKLKLTDEMIAALDEMGFDFDPGKLATSNDMGQSIFVYSDRQITNWPEGLQQSKLRHVPQQIHIHVPQQQLLAQEPSQAHSVDIEDDEHTNVVAFQDEEMADVTDASSSNLDPSYIKPRHHEPHVIEQSSFDSEDSDCSSGGSITFNDQLDYDRSADVLSIYENLRADAKIRHTHEHLRCGIN